MAVVRPQPEDVLTLICEGCGWTESKLELVSLYWSTSLGKDFCDICSARRRAESAARRAKAKKKREAKG